jgi:hypothetical protein
MLLFLFFLSSGCQGRAPTGIAPATPESIEVEMVLGPGSLNLPDLRAGLSGLSSYKSVLTISFQGTRAGQSVNWSSTYTYLFTNAPHARQMTVENSGDTTEPASVLMAEMNGAAYEMRGEGTCGAAPLDAGSPFGRLHEPAAQLTSLFGAEQAGIETVNGVDAAHYTFDERALAEYGLSTSSGELWLATEGGYVLRYLRTTTADANYFGDDTQGTLSWEYQLTDVNQPLTLELPANCPPGLVDAPMLPDAANVQNLPGSLRYDTGSPVTDARAFYERELPKLGWELPAVVVLPEGMTQEEYEQALEALQDLGLADPGALSATPTPNPDEALMFFQQGNQTLTVLITREASGSHVLVVLGRSIE